MAKVLVVEDDDDIRMYVKNRIESDGHVVLAAADGETAIAAVVRYGAPEVAVLDINLPGMNGLDLCVELREQLSMPDLPVIFLTARVNYEDVEAGRSLGATYLTKPLVTAALLNAVKQSSAPANDW